MRVVLILACLALFVAYTEAQRNCRGSVPRRQQNCVGGRVSGVGNRPRCRRNANRHMWYYDRRSRACRRMAYHGCGGNRNRYCSLAACERRCIRAPVSTPAPAPEPAPTPDPAPTPAPAPEPSRAPEPIPLPPL